MSSWSEKVDKKRETCRNAIPATWKVPEEILALLKTPVQDNRNSVIEVDLIRKSGVLSHVELGVTDNYGIERLLSELASGALTAVDVIVAYSKRAAVAHQLVQSSLSPAWRNTISDL